MKIEEKLKLYYDRAYTPYSKFNVSAIAIDTKGNEYGGCNIENGSYPATCCAERTAIFKAISEGVKEIKEIHIMANTKEPVSPCGVCRQVMTEFMRKDAKVHLHNLEGKKVTMTVEELIPYSFNLFEDRK
jgi:cytidine deaminase